MSSPHPQGFDALLAELSSDEEERALMRRALEVLPFAAEEVTPPSGLRERVIAQALAERGPATFIEQGFYFARGRELDPMVIPGGNTITWLWQDPETGARTGLVTMPPNAEFPAHPHDHIEDLYLIEGEAWVAGVRMRPGDYCRSPVGSAHVDMRSGDRGAVAFVVQR